MAAETTITLNGEKRAVAPGLTIAGLLAELAVDARRVVVEHNREIVSRENFDTAVLRDGDSLEMLTLVSGG